jgi:pentose-5-phosphate-3-epimerase
MNFKKFAKFDSLSWFWLRYFGNYRDDKVRWMVTRNPNTPPETLTRLAEDKEWVIRSGVAINPNTPPETLARLAEDEDWFVRHGVARNPNFKKYYNQINTKDMQELLPVTKNPNTSPETLARLAEDEDDMIRWQVANNPNTPPEILAHLAYDKDWSVRGGVASNPNTPPETLKQLTSDKKNIVCITAKKNPNLNKYYNPSNTDSAWDFIQWAENPNTTIDQLECYASNNKYLKKKKLVFLCSLFVGLGLSLGAYYILGFKVLLSSLCLGLLFTPFMQTILQIASRNNKD